MKPLFSPSLMCMDLLQLNEQLLILNKRADFVHVDIMDGHYVKNITLSPYFVESIRPVCTIPIDCHLMVTAPQDFIGPLVKAGAGYICPHAETVSADAFRIIDQIHAAGCKAGIVLNPSTPVSSIQYYIDRLDKITVMSVDPGFAGQRFIPEMLKKVSELKQLKESEGYRYLIEIDGSCNSQTYKQLYEAGVEVYIVGSSGLFSLDGDLETAWNKMINNFNNAIGN